MLQIDPAGIKSEMTFCIPIQVKFSDIDGYLHVNNGIYFNYFEHSRGEFLLRKCDWDIMEFGAVVARVEMDFIRPIHLEDEVEAVLSCSRIGNSSFDLEQYLVGKTKEGEEVVYAKCKCTVVSVDINTKKPSPLSEIYRAKLQPKL
ncbi:acyl-CoA thioester hydrolase [Algoriphagus ratkowskyi]|uniref:Acyl-CoA thioester hydrolase n=1 Tax=Algoriphagus ratkowskyi TaxID=57028 RepID=A0A2W7QUD9_9BACT|nr:thioesterase family protein [Algoriphagus ratkowskyi]PZX51874.1 acyl-CoA thioester hydrolase [Algoriphagus ratkowskyi]TXD75995.1 acyl-CoA thioesterase [Algoriphagus ratkowskyi]